MKLANDGETQIEMPLLREVLYENMFAESNFFIYNRCVTLISTESSSS